MSSENVEKLNTYRAILKEIEVIEDEKQHHQTIVICVALISSCLSVLVICVFPSFCAWLLNKVGFIRLVTSSGAAAASFLFGLASLLYFLIKSSEIDEQRNRLIRRLNDGFSNVQYWNKLVKEDEIHKLTIDLLIAKLQEEAKLPKLKPEK